MCIHYIWAVERIRLQFAHTKRLTNAQYVPGNRELKKKQDNLLFPLIISPNVDRFSKFIVGLCNESAIR